MNERRAASRQRVFKAGSIEFDGAGVDCVIRDISRLGAGIEVGSSVGIPREITLCFLTRRVRRNCYLVWRKENLLGVMFEPLASNALH